MTVHATSSNRASGGRAIHRETSRRGMLLLLVVLMLALFMAIGAWLITVAMRSRASARAFSASSLATSMNEAFYREALDEALLAALRGSPAAGNSSVAATGSTPAIDSVVENLLDDKYGPPITGSASIQAVPTSAYATLSLTSLTLPPVVSGSAFVAGTGTVFGSQLNGRIITFVPQSGGPVSFRILGASGSATTAIAASPASGTITCHFATPPSKRYAPLPSGTFSAVVNGREFTPQSGTSSPENWDAFDVSNLWLAEPVISGSLAGQLERMNRVSFFGEQDLEEDPALFGERVDNDNDGIFDGLWMPSNLAMASILGTGSTSPVPRVIPDRSSPFGGTIRTQVSYLILDLDGRVNINACGTTADVPTSFYSAQPSDVRMGMGYGPADLRPSFLFPVTVPASGTSSPPGPDVWTPLLKSGVPQLSGTAVSPEQRRFPPSIGYIEGRYGRNGTPGAGGDDAGAAQITYSAVPGSYFPDYFSAVSGTSTLADLKACRKVYMAQPGSGEISPTLVFFTGTTSLAPPAASAIANAALADSEDDPYELRLDEDAPRPAESARLVPAATGTAVSPATADNPFTVGELEAILRATDADATQIPQRLAAALNFRAQQARFTISTDSWDTPALTGGAAVLVDNFLTTSATAASFPLMYGSAASWRTTGTSATNSVSPDVASGLRFNVNRPLVTASDRYEYCKGLYTLVAMLSGTAFDANLRQSAAQWAVNAVDFRDEDDAITIFEYDTNPSNGWNVDGNPATATESERAIACGSERPDVVITQTAASDGTKPGETAQLLVTLRRMPHTIQAVGTSGTLTVSGSSLRLTSPAWQLRFASNRVVRFPLTTTPPTTYSLFQSGTFTTITPAVTYSGTNATITLTSDTNAYVCISPATVGPPFAINGIPRYVITSGGTFALPGNSNDTVVLERVADPTFITGSAGSASNPYIVVDQAPVTVDSAAHSRAPPASINPSALFWVTSTTSWPPGGTSLGQYSGSAPWFHWPNRPFISQAEMALVPTGTSPSYRIFTDASFPTSSLIHNSAPISFGTAAGTGTSSLGNLLLDATYVPSRFAGNTGAVSATMVDGFGFDILQSGSAPLSKWREPGKINVNTISFGTSGTSSVGNDAIVWAILMDGTSVPNRFAGSPRMPTQPANPGGSGVPATPAVPRKPAQPGNPPKSTGQLLSLSGTMSAPAHYAIYQSGSAELSGTTPGSGGYRELNPFFTYARAIRLANTATVRSQVFAIWITVKITDDSPNAPPPVTKRLFAIIDRSIPVGYAPGRDLNVRDTIRLKRYLD